MSIIPEQPASEFIGRRPRSAGHWSLVAGAGSRVLSERTRLLRREIDAVLVMEMTRWGRSTQDLMDTLGELASWDVSLIATTGLTFDLSTPQGKLVANLMASLAEFEHDLLRERARSGVAAAKARGQVFGRRRGYRPSDKHAPEVMRLIEEEGYSQRRAAERLSISKTTVNEIVKRTKQEADSGSSGA